MTESTKNAEKVMRLARRDGGLRCWYCSTELVPPIARYRESGRYPTIDHVIPRSRGGTRADFNCVLACARCNNRKGAQVDALYRRLDHLEAENRRLRALLERTEAVIVRNKLWNGIPIVTSPYRIRNPDPNPCRRCKGVHVPRTRDACWPPGRNPDDDTLLGKRVSRSLDAENTGPTNGRIRNVRQRTQAARDRALLAAGLVA